MADQPGSLDQSSSSTNQLPVPLATATPARHRADSARSGMSGLSVGPHAPANTPMSPSSEASGPAIGLEQAVRNLGLSEHLEHLQREEPGRFWEHDTIVPDNTPATGTPTSRYRVGLLNLPRIDETLETLAQPASDQLSSTSASREDSKRKSRTIYSQISHLTRLPQLRRHCQLRLVRTLRLQDQSIPRVRPLRRPPGPTRSLQVSSSTLIGMLKC